MTRTFELKLTEKELVILRSVCFMSQFCDDCYSGYSSDTDDLIEKIKDLQEDYNKEKNNEI